MPYKDPEKQREAVNRGKRKYRAKKQLEEDWLKSEAERKAIWYAANKEKKNKNQIRNRQEKREQILQDLSKEIENE